MLPDTLPLPAAPLLALQQLIQAARVRASFAGFERHAGQAALRIRDMLDQAHGLLAGAIADDDRAEVAHTDMVHLVLDACARLIPLAATAVDLEALASEVDTLIVEDTLPIVRVIAEQHLGKCFATTDLLEDMRAAAAPSPEDAPALYGAEHTWSASQGTRWDAWAMEHHDARSEADARFRAETLAMLRAIQAGVMGQLKGASA